MSKISIYEVAPVPKLADKLIGTSVGGVIEDITYNFTLQELLTLFIPNIPQNTLQGVLDYGNTATQNINLTGTINTTTLNVGATANILNSYLTGETHITGGLYDRLNSVGTAGQVLRSTGSKVEWYTVPTVIPNLQQVLTSGNTADVDIILNADIQALNINTNTETVFDELILDGSLRDYNGLIGTSGQVLSSTGTQVEWVDLPVYTATSPLSINNITKVISIQKADGTHDGYLSSLDWINFDGKQNAISLTTTGSNGAATFVSNVLNIPNYTLAGLGGVPTTRTLTINGVTYDLSANRSWTIPAGISSITVAEPMFSTGGSDPIIGMNQAGSSQSGYLWEGDYVNFNRAYNNSIVSASVTGTSTKTLTLNQQDGDTIQASWSDADTGLTSVGVSMPSAFSVANSPLTSNGTIAITGAGSNLQYIDGTGSLRTFPTIANEAATLVTEVYNETGATLTKGTVVYINGGHGNLPTVTKAIATGDATSAQTYGVVQVDITNMNNGHVVVIGSLGDLDTQAYSNGTQLYLSSTTAGEWTSVKQYAPAHLVYVGIVVRSHPTQGVVEIKIQNGFEMDELHNVYAQNPNNNAILQYKTSTSLWTSVDGTTTNIAEGTNLYYLDSRARAALSANSPLSYNNTTGVFSISQSNSSTNGYLSSTDWNTFNNKVGSVTASLPISSSGGSTPNITIQQASGSQDGYLSSTDWTTFNNKQAAGNYITSLTGEASATGPGAASVTLDNSAVTGKVLTGVNITGGSISSTDSILTAFGKVQNQINGLIGGSIYKGTWNANTNTPTLTSGVGTRGWYYIVNVAGTTNLDGITDWNIGDWAIFDGTAWQQVDNTDAVVSVNGFTGAVSLTTDNIPEGSSNLYFLDSRARAALSFSAGSGAYSSSTGIITIPTNTSQLTNGANFITLGSLSGVYPIGYDSGTGAISISQSGNLSDGYLSSTDWNTFNNKQNALTNPVTGTGTVNYLSKFTGTSSIGDSIVYDNGSGVGINTSSPYASSSFKLDVNGGLLIKNTSGTTAQLVLIDSDPSGGGNNGFVQLTAGGTSSSSYGALQTYYGTSIVGGALRLQPNGGSVLINNLLDSGLASLQVTGAIQQSSVTSSMIKTNSSGVFTSAIAGTDYVDPSTLSGYVPTSRTLTINGVTYDLSADRTWSITAGVSSVTATSPLFSSGGSTPNLTIQPSSSSQDGYLSSTDWNTFNGKIGGSGTTNFLPKFTGSGTIGNSVAYDGGSSIGINTTTPYDSTQFKLDVNGGLLVKNTSGAAAQLVLINANPAVGGNEGFFIQSVGGNSSTTWAQIQTYYGTSIASGALRLQPTSGQVLVGTTTTSAFMVDINGSLRANGQLTLGSTISNGTYTYTLPSGTGTLALTSDLSGYVPTSRTLTINGVTYDLSANRSWTITAGISSVSGTAPISVSTVSGAATVSISQATTSTDGYLSSTDWNIFNNKVPPSRTLTINGTTYDLSANRSWTITPNINATTTQDYTATAGQTVFTVTGGYTVGQLAVFYNGSKLASNEFTAINGTTFTLAVACQVNDIVQAVASVTGGGIGGSGTTNYIPKFNSSGIIGNSTLQQVGSGWMQLGDSSVNTGELDIIGNSGSKVFLYDGYGSATMQSYYNDSFTILTQVGGQTTNVMDYNYVTKTLIFQTNGNNTRLNITSSGNVGIGNTNNTYKLDVTGTGNFSGDLIGQASFKSVGRIFSTSDANYGDLVSTTGALVLSFDSTGQQGYLTSRNYATATDKPLNYNGSSHIFNGGKVSVSALDGESFKLQLATSTGNNYLRFYSSAGSGLGYIGSFYSGGTQLMLVDGSGTDLSLNGNANLLLRTGGTERMRIVSAGNVCIGMTSSAYGLVAIKSNGSTPYYGLNVYANGNGNFTYMNHDNNVGIIGTEFGVSGTGHTPLTFQVGGSERMRITTSGNLGVGAIPAFNTRIRVRGADQSSSSYTLICDNAVTDTFYIRNDGYINVGTAASSPYNNTYGNAANAFLSSDGSLGRSTSSLKYKKNVENYTKGLNEVMQLRPVSYQSKNTKEDGITFAGLIAEEVHELGLTEFVQYAEDGTPDALAYQNMVALLVKAIQEQQAQIEELKAKIK